MPDSVGPTQNKPPLAAPPSGADESSCCDIAACVCYCLSAIGDFFVCIASFFVWCIEALFCCLEGPKAPEYIPPKFIELVDRLARSPSGDGLVVYAVTTSGKVKSAVPVDGRIPIEFYQGVAKEDGLTAACALPGGYYFIYHSGAVPFIASNVVGSLADRIEAQKSTRVINSVPLAKRQDEVIKAIRGEVGRCVTKQSQSPSGAYWYTWRRDGTGFCKVSGENVPTQAEMTYPGATRCTVLELSKDQEGRTYSITEFTLSGADGSGKITAKSLDELAIRVVTDLPSVIPIWNSLKGYFQGWHQELSEQPQGKSQA